MRGQPRRDAADILAEALGSRLTPYPSAVLTGRLGKSDTGEVETGRPGIHWVRILQYGGSLARVWNPTTDPTPGLDVNIGYSQDAPTRLHVLGVNYEARGGPEYWADVDGNIPDYRKATYVFKRQLAPMHGHVAPAGGMNIEVFFDTYYHNSRFQFFPGDTIDLSAYVPSAGARFVHVYMEPDDDGGTLGVEVGDVILPLGAGGFPTSPGAADDVTPVPPVGTRPVIAVLLTEGMTALSEGDLYDYRDLFSAIGSDIGTFETEIDAVKQMVYRMVSDLDATITALVATL